MLVYHGTTKQGLENILAGVHVKETAPWNVCEYDNLMYVYPTDKVADTNLSTEELDEDDLEMVRETAINDCFWQASVQSIFNNDCELFVIEFEVDDDLLMDDATGNMETRASCLYMEDFDPSMIKAIVKHDLNVYRKPLILSGLLWKPIFNKEGIDLHLLEVAENIDTNNLNPDLITEFDYETYR